MTSTDDGEIQADTYVKMGELSASHLGMPDQSVGYYEKAIDASPAHMAAIAALEQIYAERDVTLAKEVARSVG